jgi:hypothetical protein
MLCKSSHFKYENETLVMRIGFLFGWCLFTISLFLNGQINAATITLSKTDLYVGEELQITVQPEQTGNEIAVYLLAKDDFDETMKRQLCEYLPGRIHGYQTVTHRSAAGTFTVRAGPRLGDMYVIVNEFDQTTQDVICSGAQALAHHMGFSCENIALPGCLNVTPQFREKDGVCLPSITDDPVNGGYIASYLTEWWDTPFSEIRTNRCTEFFDPDFYPDACTICLQAPHVGVVYQRNGFPDVAAGSFGLGTEAVIYVWGYTRNPENDYRNWLRNGELRFSIYLNLTFWDGNSQYRGPHDHAWWNWGGKNAWTAKTNLIYTDIYKLNATRYEPW